MTLTQKILADHAVGGKRPPRAGDLVRVQVDWTIASELAWNGMNVTYDALGRPRLEDPSRFFLAVDHTVDPMSLANDERTQKLVEMARSFAREAGLRHFYDANQTILHTKFHRELVQPGQVVVGADSHTTSHGGVGAVAFGLGGADVTAASILGQTWIEVPEAILVEYRGVPPFGVGGKDIILRTLGLLRCSGAALGKTVEYRGERSTFSTDTRFTICNMTAELGGLNGIFQADETVAHWLEQRRDNNDGARYFRAEDGAPYSARYGVELDGLAPQVAMPPAPDRVVDVDRVARQAFDGCFIGACTTTEEELVLAGLVLNAALRDGHRPRPLPPGRRLVVPGDLGIRARLAETGIWSIYEQAGFVVDPPGCSMCLGIASRRARQGEVWLSSQNRNFPNRMGEGSHAWLASAATVAASSFELALVDPRPLLAQVDRTRFDRIMRRAVSSPAPVVRTVEPAVDVAPPAAVVEPDVVAEETVRGRVQRFGDLVDTDAMIAGQFCHFTSEDDLGAKCFAFFAPEFRRRVQEGATIVVAGHGWGTGSSREQAVWALRGAGVTVIIARSFGFTHKRNLVNEGFPFLTVGNDAFYDLASDGRALEVDLARDLVRDVATGRLFQAEPTPPIARNLRVVGGLVAAMRRHGRDVLSVLAAS